MPSCATRQNTCPLACMEELFSAGWLLIEPGWPQSWHTKVCPSVPGQLVMPGDERRPSFVMDYPRLPVSVAMARICICYTLLLTAQLGNRSMLQTNEQTFERMFQPYGIALLVEGLMSTEAECNLLN